MIQFNRIGTSPLYLSDANQVSGGWGFAITRTLPEGQQLPPSASLRDALTNLTWQGSFVYVATGPYPGCDGDPATFVDHLRSFIADASVAGQGAIIFLPDRSADQLDVNTLQTYTLLNRTSPTRITPSGPGLNVALTSVDGLRMLIKPNAQLSVPDDGDRIDLDLTNSPVATLGGTFAPSVKAPVSNGAQLHFSGTANGAFTFPLTIVQSTLYTQTNWGFQFLIPSQGTVAGVGATPVKYLAAWLPFADPGPPNAVLGFIAQVNEVNPRNQIADASRTVFGFDGTGTDTALASYYRTSVGKPITLTPVPTGNDPAGLVINDGYGTTPIQNGLRLAPVGDFVLAVDGAAPGQPQSLLCGTSGTETIDFLPEIAGTQSGTRLRFVANQPADIPQFPVQAASPVGPPVEAGVAAVRQPVPDVVGRAGATAVGPWPARPLHRGTPGRRTLRRDPQRHRVARAEGPRARTAGHHQLPDDAAGRIHRRTRRPGRHGRPAGPGLAGDRQPDPESRHRCRRGHPRLFGRGSACSRTRPAWPQPVPG